MTASSSFSAHWPRFMKLLSERTGLQVRDKDQAMVLGALETRRKVLGLVKPEQYLEVLEGEAGSGEWTELLPLLTNGESYFLRDSRQFTLLRETILPELLEAHAKDRQLRLWSAGCSTGEEVYSLAMLVDELAPRSKGWNALVLGTDINQGALARARQGIYSQWSFRGVPDEVRERYFQKIGKGWQVNPSLRALVEFRPLNLRGTEYPQRSNGLADVDLIVCRNVLIYLDADAVAHALHGFTATLRAGGFLLTGHAELAHQSMTLRARLFPESVAYQKPAIDSTPLGKPKPERSRPESAPAVTTPTTPQRMPVPPSSSVPRVRLVTPAPTADTDTNSNVTNAGTAANQVVTLCEQARREANLGRYGAAVAALREAVGLDPVHHDTYAIWAQVASEQGDDEEAKRLLKKVVFLVPSRVEAWLDLGALYAASGDAARAKRMRQTALELLEALPKDAVVYHGTAMGAEALRTHVAELLSATETR